jgi:NADH-quinone oxidoreductase subunit M
VFATFGMVLAAAYLLTMFQKVFLGEYKGDEAHANAADHIAAHHVSLSDLDWREVIACVPLILMCFIIGIYATPFFQMMSASVEALLTSGGLAAR